MKANSAATKKPLANNRTTIKPMAPPLKDVPPSVAS
jgi:hypothetical protein